MADGASTPEGETTTPPIALEINPQTGANKIRLQGIDIREAGPAIVQAAFTFSRVNGPWGVPDDYQESISIDEARMIYEEGSDYPDPPTSSTEPRIAFSVGPVKGKSVNLTAEKLPDGSLAFTDRKGNPIDSKRAKAIVRAANQRIQSERENPSTDPHSSS